MFPIIFMCLWLSLGDSMADPIKPLLTSKDVDEGDNVTLSCSYKNSASVPDYLYWYKQYPKSKPEYLLFLTPSGFKSDSIPRLSAKVDNNKKQVDLLISSAAVSDSALYYCALRPTVTGNPTALHRPRHTPRKVRNLDNPCSLNVGSAGSLSFSIGLWNCQSAFNKADFIPAFATYSNFSVLALTETWIHTENTATLAALASNYNFSHTSHPNR
ncbi:uncharacterized protein LOC128632981 [Ictalurus punctatus]|uniref:Uncharacterized protein LOC128632981 n=1 Tax=Ictalurus punctatus TaxID=7998 RepID=A0A9F7RIZ9_ICTPU|nr:uncharacterized protein LOC128632981 [Ictalurus punctatus]